MRRVPQSAKLHRRFGPDLAEWSCGPGGSTLKLSFDLTNTHSPTSSKYISNTLRTPVPLTTSYGLSGLRRSSSAVELRRINFESSFQAGEGLAEVIEIPVENKEPFVSADTYMPSYLRRSSRRCWNLHLHGRPLSS